MSWVRLDDQIAHHPKVTKCSPTACWLWVTAIGFSQKFLTDGFIPSTSIPALSHVKHPGFYIRELVKARLLDIVDGGYQIHDYLDWNQTATHVKQRREADRVRKESARIPRGQTTESARSPQSVLARAPASNPIHKDQQQQQRAGRPIFEGHRFVVMPFMQEALERILGTDAKAFELGAWYWALDGKLAKKPALDTEWPWLRREMLKEARTRGLLLGSADEIAARERGAGNGNGHRAGRGVGGSRCPHEPRCATNQACIQRVLAESRQQRAAR